MEKLPEDIDKWCEENNLDKVLVSILYRSINSPGYIKKFVEDCIIGVEQKDKQ